MSGDFTNKLPASDSEKLTLILTTVEALGPIWQKVVADIAQLQEGQRALSTEVRADILQLREGQRALSTEVRALRRDIDNRFGVMYDKLVETEIDHRDLHDRISRLELNHDPPNSQT